ncbi:mRNA-decapping enzyme subunit 1 [Dillenia turbinata]|uniref:mRNA-decapping enzyme subunit 1 n=1 Tax=Dillenia turbinata TaxID=194707 RepID=A0AAN8ZAN6_9MAGN
MSANGKLMSNLDQQSTKLPNLTVFQRIDPFVEEILIAAAYVTLYKFNIQLSQWVYCSEFEELETIPTMVLINGPLEPASSTLLNAQTFLMILPSPNAPDFFFLLRQDFKGYTFVFISSKAISFQISQEKLLFITVKNHLTLLQLSALATTVIEPTREDGLPLKLEAPE